MVITYSRFCLIFYSNEKDIKGVRVDGQLVGWSGKWDLFLNSKTELLKVANQSMNSNHGWHCMTCIKLSFPLTSQPYLVLPWIVPCLPGFNLLKVSICGEGGTKVRTCNNPMSRSAIMWNFVDLTRDSKIYRQGSRAMNDFFTFRLEVHLGIDMK